MSLEEISKKLFSYVSISAYPLARKLGVGDAYVNFGAKFIVFNPKEKEVLQIVKDYLIHNLQGIDISDFSINIYPKNYLRKAKELFLEGKYISSETKPSKVLSPLYNQFKLNTDTKDYTGEVKEPVKELTVEKYMELSDFYNKVVDNAHDELHKVINGRKDSSGFVNDDVRNSNEYKEATTKYNAAFKLLRDFNSTVPKKIALQAYEMKKQQKIMANKDTMKYGTRTKYIESLIYSGKVTDEEKRLLQNGFIPEKYLPGLEKDEYNSYSKPDSDIDPLIFGNYFHKNPEKVSGKIVEGSGYINPVKVKGNIDDSIKALETMKRNANMGYKGFAKINQEAKRNIENMKTKPKFNKGDIVQDSKGKAKIIKSYKPKVNTPFYGIENYQYDIEREDGKKGMNMRESSFELLSTSANQKLINSQINATAKMAESISISDNVITEQKTSESAEPQKETVSVETVPSIIHNAEAIIENKDNSLGSDKKFYTVEDSVKFLNPGISEDELKAWVWYKRLHGNPMKGWNKWFIASENDKTNKLVYAKEETEILGNNYKPIGFVPKGSLIGLKTKFENTYGENTFVVCKTSEGTLIWVNKAHIEEKDTVNVSNDSELDKLVRNGALVYTGIDYLPIPMFLFGNYYNKIKGLEKNKEAIITKFDEETYNNTISILDKFKPKQKSFGDPVPSRRPFVSCLSEIANDAELFGVLQLNEDVNIRLGQYKRNRFHETTDKISLFDAFQFYLSQYVKDTDIKNTNKTNIKNYYFAKAVKWPKDEDKNDIFTESQKAELVGNARFEAERLFSDFLANGLTIEDRMKLDIEWNRMYNSMSNVNNFVHKVPIGYEGSAMFKAGKLIIKPAQREGLAYLSIVGAGCLAYEVGFGKTACGILNLAQLLSQGKVQRPLLVVPKPTYKNWLKELFGYYSDGSRTELSQFEGSKYYYGILSGTSHKLNDWYNLAGKTLKRLVSEYGSEEGINKLIPAGTITIVSYQGFEQIGFGRDVSEKVFDSIYEALAQKREDEEEGKSDREEAKEYQKIRELMGIAQKNTIVDIDRLGFDHITVDEAHNFKNAFASCGKDPATGRKLFGIQANRSNRAVKMFFHTQYIQRYYGKNVVLLTATPFTNSPLEFFSMISYVGLDSLLNYNLWSIQKFFEQFVMQTVEYTVDAKGELKVKPVIKSIQNLGLFQTILFNLFHRKDDPKEAGITRPCLLELPNKDVSTHLDMNEYQIRNQANVRGLVESYSKDNKGAILNALNLSQNNAFSPFLAAKEQPEGAKDFVEQSPKIHYICECIKSVKEYHELRGEECSGQVIYSNRGVEYFDYIKEYLHEYCGFKTGLEFDGEKIDEVEIVTGGGAEKEEDWKETVKEAFNAGIVKVIIGTSTIKEGVNLQERGTVIYLALPEYNPSDIQQLKGRIWRQGNMYGYVRFVAPLVVNSMDAFIWQKLDEKQARLGSIWVKTENNISEMSSELSPEEIKYSLVESATEKLKIKLGSETNKAEYDNTLAAENLEIFDKVNFEIGQLREFIGKAKDDILKKMPRYSRLLEVVTNDMLPYIEESQDDEKPKIKKKIQDLREKLSDLISQFAVIRDTDWNNPKEILAFIRMLQQRTYEFPQRWDMGLTGQLYKNFIVSENIEYNLFDFNGWIKNEITSNWSTIAKAERSVFQPYGKSWNDDTTELREILKKRFDETKLYLQNINSDEYKTTLIGKIEEEIKQAQEKRGSVKDRVTQFKESNNLLSYLKDNTDLDNCPIPKEPCCEFNNIVIEEHPDVYNEDVIYEAEMPKIIEREELQSELKSEMNKTSQIESLETRIELIKEMIQEAKGKAKNALKLRVELLEEMLTDLK